jgi:quercetin dioxygenase-like cupin family protein
MTIKILNAFEAQEIPTPHKVSARKLMDYEHALVMMLDLKPKETLLPHITPVDVFFYILEGEGEVKIGDEVQVVKKDDIIFSPAKIVHLVRNPHGETNLRLLVVKTPKPTKETKLL